MKNKLFLLKFAAATLSCMFFSHTIASTAVYADATENTELPARFDLRDEGAMTSVKHQYNGTCGIFSAMAAIESNMIKQGMADSSLDLAEEHFSWFTFGKGSPDDINDPLFGDRIDLGTEGYKQGASFWKFIGTLACWTGVVPASMIPNIDERGPIDESLRYESIAHLQEALQFDCNDMDDIKIHLMERGAMELCYFSIGKPEHYSEYGAYYQTDWDYNSENKPEDLDGGGHAVCLCGWDDNFPKENFIETPPGDGAWICKNSWGDKTTAGIDGYTYISYYDPSIHDIIQYNVEPTDNYDGIYQLCGGAFAAYTIRNRGWVYSNIYTAKKDDNITAVSILTHEADLPYEISIYALNDGYKDPRDGKLLTQISGTEHYAGYHTYQLEDICRVSEGQKFSAVVKTGIHPSTTIFFDANADNSGTSFYTFYNEKGESAWTDSTANENHGNTFIKLFTKDDAAANIMGDVNDDGNFNIADAVLLQKWLLSETDTYLPQWQQADFDNNDILNIFDLCIMKNELLCAVLP